MKIKRIYFFLYLFLCFNYLLISDDNSSDLKEKIIEENEWLKDYIALEPEDDIFYFTKIKNYIIDKEFVKNLKYQREINFNFDQFEEYKVRQNSNLIPRFPWAFIAIGGYSLNRGFDIGFLYRVNNFINKKVILTSAISYGQTNRFYQLFGLEYPSLIKDNRLGIFFNTGFWTSHPQYESYYDHYKFLNDRENYSNNFIMKLFNFVWEKIYVRFPDKSDIGFFINYGFNYRIPKIEVNSITSMEILYFYLDQTFIYNSEIKKNKRTLISESNFSVNIKEEFKWNKLKQTATVPVGNQLSGSIRFYIPTGAGRFGSDFRLKIKLEDTFYYKIFKEYLIKTRFFLSYNYNISDDYSGDPYFRGCSKYELTGFFALLGNLEVYLPLINVDIKEGPDQNQLVREAKFILYLSIFCDLGFTIDNYNYILDKYYIRPPKSSIRNSMDKNNPYGQINLGNENYLIPAVTTGGGIRIYPYFLHFILRFDIGFNIIKAIVYGSATESMEIVISFSDMF